MPALVTPLLNCRTQIQPPSNTWCTAASSTGYGGFSSLLPSACRVEPSDSREVAVKRLGARKIGQRKFLQLESAMQKAARARCVDEELRRETCRVALPLAFEDYYVCSDWLISRKLSLVAILRSQASVPRGRGRCRSRRDTSAYRRSRRTGSQRPGADRCDPGRRG